MASDQVKIANSQIKTSKFSVCTTNLAMTSSSVDTNGRGCISDSGLGAGVKFDGCAASGASHGGSGGSGAKITDSGFDVNCQKYHPAPYLQSDGEGRYEGSGGGSGFKDSQSGGKGGGIIWLNAANNMYLKDTQILSEGMNGLENGVGNGGGSGGSIQVITGQLEGNGYMSVIGGNGSTGGGGAGAGGRLIINYLGNYLSDYFKQRTLNWQGSLNVRSGRSGRLLSNMEMIENNEDSLNGTVWHPKCLSGYSGGFCDPCPVGTYKYGYSYGKCISCENKPDNAYYTSLAVNTAQCPYQCNDDRDTASTNPDCLNQIELQIQRLGTSYMALAVLSLFLGLSLLQWIFLVVRQKSKRQQASQRKIKVYMGIDQSEEQKTALSQPNKSKNASAKDQLLSQNNPYIQSTNGVGTNIEIKDRDLWHHTYRLYLIGYNSIKFPWIITKDIPKTALNDENFAKLEQVIESHNNQLQWNVFNQIIFGILRIIYPPFANAFHSAIRKRNYFKLRRLLLQTFDRDFWEDHSVNQTFRISCSKSNYNLAHIDFLDFSKQFSDYTGPKLPMIQLISGTGTFNNPYHLDYINDPYIKSVVMLNKKELRQKLPMYLENLDSLLRRLSFYHLTGQTLKDLNTLLEHIDFGNKHLFYPINVRMTLYLFENKYSHDGEQKSRRSFPIDSQLFEAFQRTFKILMKYVKLRLFQKKSEIKFGLVFTKLNEAKQKRVDEKIQMYIQRQNTEFEKKPTKQDAHQQQKTDEDDNDMDKTAMEQIDALEQAFTKNNYNINFSIQRSDSLMFADYIYDNEDEFEDEYETEDQSFNDRFDESIMKKDNNFLKNGNTERLDTQTDVRGFRDRSKRAFSISKDSTKSLELSLKKPRNSCKHRCSRTLSVIYSIYLMLFQFQAKPPRKGYYIIYLVYSILVSLDIIVALNFTFHLIYPIENLLTFGLVFYCLYPLLPIISPILGFTATITGSPMLMKNYMKVNALLCLFNYPATMIAQIYYKDQAYNIMLVFVMLLLKILISFFGGKVRADLENPHFHKNRLRLKQMTKEENLRKSLRKNQDSDEEYEYSSDEIEDESKYK